MRKPFFTILLICLLLLSAQAYADLSTNLQVVKETNPVSRKVVRESYVDFQGNPVVASDKGYAIVEYIYNASNLQKEIRFQDAQEKLVNNAEGYACIKYEYNTNKIIKTSYLDVDGNLAMGPDGFAVQEIKRGTKGVQTESIEYDAEGSILTHSITEYVDLAKSNLIKSISWYDGENNPTAGPSGYARVEYEYFKFKKSKITYFNAEGGLFYYEKEGFACKENKYVNGKVRELNYYGSDGNLVSGPNGFAQAKYTYAQGGKETLTMYYNADGSCFFNNKGYCGIKQIKENRRVVDESYYAGEGVRGMCKEGYSRTTKRYTLRGQVIRQCFYDEDDNLMVPPEIGYAKVQNTYNTRYLIKTEYFNEKEEPAFGPEGYAVAVNTYANKVQADTIFYDTDGKTVINGANGYARIVYQYNDQRQKIGETYYDAEGNLVNVNGDADEIRWEWKNGNIVSESYWKDGQPVNGEKGYHEVRKDYTADKKIKSEFYYDSNGNLVKSEDGYAGIEKMYNSSKKEMATLYYDESGSLMLAPGKEYAYVLTIPQKDRQILTEETEEEEQETDQVDEEEPEEDTKEAEEEEVIASSTIYVEYYGTDKKLMNLSSGYAYIIRRTDAQRRVIQEEYFDNEGRKTALKNGHDEIRQYYSESRRPDRIEYYLNGVPTLYDNNYAAVERGYDKAGNISVERYFDISFNPAPCKNGYEMIWKAYDEDKRLIKEAYFDRDGQPMTSNKGIYQRAYEYNENGKVSKEAFFDADGKPMACTDGYMGLERLYNDQGNSIATLYLNEDNEVILTPGKEYAYSITTPIEDEMAEGEGSGKTVYIEYYGTDRQLINLAAGYAAILRQTDEQGRTTREAYFDKDGNSVAQKNEYDELRQVFDVGTKPIRIEYYLNGEPALRKDGYAAVEREYDEAGNVIVEKYYDATLQPAPCNNGYEAIRREYNDNKKVVKEEYYDHDGQPMTSNKGIYQRVYEYNENGKVYRELYFDTDDSPAMCQDGYAGLERLYNDQGDSIATLYMNEAYEVILAPGKEYAYSITTPKEDEATEGEESRKTVYIEYYGTDRKLMNLSAGYAAVLRQTDEKSRTTREVYFDKDGNRVTQKNEYDELRQAFGEGTKPIRIEYYLNGEPVLCKEGYAAVEREYDEAGNVIAEKYYDAILQPAPCNNGYEAIRREYNDNKKVVKEEYCDHDGQPMTNKKGVYQTAFEYNENGKVTKESYFDGEGQPMACQDGYAAIERMYNSQGGNMATLYYDESGELMLTPGKEYAYQVTIPKVDKDGAAEEEENIKSVYLEYYGTDRKLMTVSYGYAAVLRKTDKQGRTVGEVYFDENGQKTTTNNTYDEVYNIYTDSKTKPSRIEYYRNDIPVLRTEGFAAIEREYDEAGNVIVEKYYDAEFNPTKRNGYEMIRKGYNVEKRVIKEAYFTNAGEPMVNNKGVYETTFEYNELGKLIQEAYFDPEGKPMANNSGYIKIERAYNEEGKKISETSYTLESLE